MLTLTRRVGEAVVILPGVAIVVLEASHGRVKLGFAAPPSVRIWRWEIARLKFPELAERFRDLLGRLLPVQLKAA